MAANRAEAWCGSGHPVIVWLTLESRGHLTRAYGRQMPLGFIRPRG
jgi:hypothetical protein